MKWTRPTWSISVDLLSHGLVMLGILAAAGVSRLFAW